MRREEGPRQAGQLKASIHFLAKESRVIKAIPGKNTGVGYRSLLFSKRLECYISVKILINLTSAAQFSEYTLLLTFFIVF